MIEAEVRSLDDSKASERMREMVDGIGYAASATETDVDTTVEEQFRAYRIPEDHPAVPLAAAALRDWGVEPVPTSTGGGSDAGAFEAKGFRCVNLAIGVEANHTPGERVSRRGAATRCSRWRRESWSAPRAPDAAVLKLRRARVVSVEEAGGRLARLTSRSTARTRRGTAIAYPELTGRSSRATR